MKLSEVEWIPVAKAVYHEYNNDDVPGLAAEMAYNFIFAVFPFIIFLATLTGLVGHVIGQDKLFDQIMNNLYQALPSASAESLRGPLNEVLKAHSGGALSFGLVIGVILTLSSASNGVATVMKAFNRAYGVEETRSFVERKVLSVGLTLILSLLVIFGFVALTFGGQIGDWIASLFGFGLSFGVVWNVLRFLLTLMGISFALALLYWKGPNVAQEFRWISPGSALATLCWLIATVAFGVYVQFMGGTSYSKTYGTIFGLILFLLYLYLSSTVVLLGAEFNAETTKRYDPETIRDKVTDPRKQLPGKQPMPHPKAAAEAGVAPADVAASNERSAQKLAGGGRGPETATAFTRAGSDETTADLAPKGTGRANGRHGEDERGGQRAAEPAGSRAGASTNGRTRLATFALSGAALASAVLLGALQKKQQS